LEIAETNGIDVLTKELRSVGKAYFLRQYDRGTDDYTTERESLLSDVTMESALSDLEAQRKKENQEGMEPMSTV